MSHENGNLLKVEKSLVFLCNIVTYLSIYYLKKISFSDINQISLAIPDYKLGTFRSSNNSFICFNDQP